MVTQLDDGFCFHVMYFYTIILKARIHQLLGQNQELLEHVNVLVQRLVQLEASHVVKAQLEIPQLPKVFTVPH